MKRKSNDETIDAIVTFVMFQGEVLAMFRATKRRDETEWHKEEPRHVCNGPGMIWVQASYAHVGQHSEAACDILDCRRATRKEYKPLLDEMNSIGYRVTPHQRGRLKLKGRK